MRVRLVTVLLVSVRNQEEFQVALDAGVGIVDLKEPRRGPLAPVGSDVWQQITASLTKRSSEACPQQCSPLLSAALGESNECSAIIGQLPSLFHFAKVGPSGMDQPQKLTRLWREAGAALAETSELVAVAYADYQSARCLDPTAVFRLAGDLGLRHCLIDTFCKNGRSTLDHLSFDQLRLLGQVAHQAGMTWALAGSVRLQMCDQLQANGVFPDCYAVRGDVCMQGGRTGALCSQRLNLWLQRVKSFESTAFESLHASQSVQAVPEGFGVAIPPSPSR